MVNEQLQYAGYGAILSAITIIPLVVAGFFMRIFTNLRWIIALYVVLLSFSLIANIFKLKGMLIISKKIKEKFFKIMTHAMFFLVIVFFIFDVLALYVHANTLTIAMMVLMEVFGIAYIVFGISALSLSKKFKSVGKSLAILYIIEGAFYASIILIILTPLTSIAKSILEAKIFFKSAK